jgi:signal transduction histidine kinase
MVFDADNTLWCVTDRGLYRAPAGPPQTPDLKFEVVIPAEPATPSLAALADRRGRLWFGVGGQLFEVARGGAIRRHPLPDESRGSPISSIVADGQGDLLVATFDGLYEFVASADTPGGERWKRVPLALPSSQGIGLLYDSTGAVWIGAVKGLRKYKDGQSTLYTTAQGLSGNWITSMGEDREGNLWVGTWAAGVCKLSGEMIASFTRAEGLPDQHTWKVIEGRDDRIYAVTNSGGLVEISGGRATPVAGSQSAQFQLGQLGRMLQDRRGDWWIGTKQGLFRFPGPRLQLTHGQKYTSAEGISEAPVINLYEEPGGKVWISSADDHLYWCDPATGARPRFQRIHMKAISPLNSPLRRMADRTGALWMGYHNDLARLVNGKVVVCQAMDGLPETRPCAFFQDSRGWFWIGLRYRGVSVIKDPTAEELKFVNYSTENGLAGDTVWSIAEDDFGRIYLDTSRGLDQLDPQTGRIRHFTTADGLAGDEVYDCTKDRRGDIWVATSGGVSKLNLRAGQTKTWPPAIYVTRLQVAGEDLPLAETGAARVSELTLPASRNNLRLEYVGLSFQSERALRYQYRLGGVDADWSLPTDERSITYANLSPGSYRFEVRAQCRDGLLSPAPAAVAFTILPPVWQRWWFLALAIATLTAGAFALHRFRLRQAVAMERIRRQIATDIHDDMGSGLAQVAILSELAKGQTSAAGVELLDEVANLARSMRDAMSDIVWAVDPRKDRLVDLVQRMRHTAFNLLEAQGRRVEFHAPADEEIERIGLAPDRRRHVLHIFKETVTNIARHAQATDVHIRIELDAGALRLAIQDDGRGFDPQARYGGHGLHCLRTRADELRADLSIESGPGRGTTVQVTVPIR